MPNWTHNVVHIDCSQSTRDDIRAFLKGTETYEDENGKVTEETDFDFNKLIPMPKNSETFKATGNLGREEHEKYGENTWLAWSRTNWGTKWSACHVQAVEEMDDQLIYHFDTAWDAPRPIVTELRKRMKDDWGAEVEWFAIHEDGAEEETL